MMQPHATYQWTINGSPMAGTVNATYGTVGDGHSGASATDEGAGIEKQELSLSGLATLEHIQLREYFFLYPNPVTEILFIESKRDAAIEVYTVNGRMVRSKMLQAGATSEIDVSSLSQGSYLVKVIERSGVIVSKLVKR